MPGTGVENKLHGPPSTQYQTHLLRLREVTNLVTLWACCVSDFNETWYTCVVWEPTAPNPKF